MTTKTVLITTRIVLSYVMKWNIPLVWGKVNKNWDNNMIIIFQLRTIKAIEEQLKAPKERNKSKRAALRELPLGIQVGRLTIWVNLFEKI